MKLKYELITPSPIIKSLLHKESSLLATFSEDKTIRVYTTETKKLVREFKGHSDLIADMV
jgi:WD40 repeat protein